MTDRIQELMDECWDSGRGIVNPRKLAYKVVKECAKFLEENSGYDYCNNAWFPDPEDMLKHFGID